MMTATLVRQDVIARPARPPGGIRASLQVAHRALVRYIRTPGLSGMGIVQSVMFLFSFRYVFGGAVAGGGVHYAYFFIPGYVATVVLFTGGGISVAVAQDRAEGFTDRLLSLPIPRFAIVAGRVMADWSTNAWAIITTAAVGFGFGFRLHASVQDGLEALGLCLLFGLVFTIVFIVIGLLAPSVEAAQGMSMIAFLFAFISATYVPVSSMPGWMQPFAKYQPITPMVDAVRSLLVGSSHDVGLALAWSVGMIIVFTPIAIARYRRV